MSIRRVQTELNKFNEDPGFFIFFNLLFTVPGISISVKENNINYLEAVISGPAGTPYEGGKFKLELFLTQEYPMVPPKVFVSVVRILLLLGKIFNKGIVLYIFLEKNVDLSPKY
jgi:ubiquitin-protein ligase